MEKPDVSVATPPLRDSQASCFFQLLCLWCLPVNYTVGHVNQWNFTYFLNEKWLCVTCTVQNITDQTTSSSVWRTLIHATIFRWRCGTTCCVVSIQARCLRAPLSLWSVRGTFRRRGTSSCSSPSRTKWTSASSKCSLSVWHFQIFSTVWLMAVC